MPRIIRSWGTEFHVLEPHEGHEADGVIDFGDPREALHFLRRHVCDPASMRAFRQILAGMDRGTDLFRLQDEEVIERLRWQLTTGRIRISTAETTESLAAWGPRWTDEEPEDIPAPAAQTVFAAPTREEPEATHTITFKVVEDESSAPIAGVKLKVLLTTGEEKEFTTDAEGKIEITDLPPGTCDLQALSDEEAYEVVAVE